MPANHAHKSLSPDTHTAEEVVALLGLQPIDQEGGFFKRTAEADLTLNGLPAALGAAPRKAWSVIYALFTPDGFSALHRLCVDEIWCFHAGDPLRQLRLGSDGVAQEIRIGLNPLAGESPQTVVPAGLWQGTRLEPGGRWALVSCVVAPEFRWEDFVLGQRKALTQQYPAVGDEISRLTREEPPAGNR